MDSLRQAENRFKDSSAKLMTILSQTLSTLRNDGQETSPAVIGSLLYNTANKNCQSFKCKPSTKNCKEVGLNYNESGEKCEDYDKSQSYLYSHGSLMSATITEMTWRSTNDEILRHTQMSCWNVGVLGKNTSNIIDDIWMILQQQVSTCMRKTSSTITYCCTVLMQIGLYSLFT